MIRRPPRSTRTDTLFPTRRSSDLTVHHDSHVLGARARTDQQGIGGADHCYALQAEGGDRQDRALQIAVVAVDRQNFAVEDVAAVVLVGGLVERIPAADIGPADVDRHDGAVARALHDGEERKSTRMNYSN